MMVGRCQRLVVHAVCLCAGLFLGGCGLLGIGGSAAPRLPDLPYVTRNMAQGERVAFRKAELELGPVSQTEGGKPQASVTVTAGGDRRTYDLGLGDFARQGDYLVYFKDQEGVGRAGAVAGTATLAVFYLPEVQQTPPSAETAIMLRRGDVKFFPQGFLAMERASQNDPDRVEDDQVRLVVSRYDEMVRVSLMEGQQVAFETIVLAVDNVIPAEESGSVGSATVRLIPKEEFWAEAGSSTTVEFFAREGFEGQGYSLKADVLDQDLPPRVLIGLEGVEYPRDFLLKPGESARWGTMGLRLEDADLLQVSLTVFEFGEAFYPRGFLERQKLIAEEEEPPENVPTRITRTMRPDEPVEFHGATISLGRTVANDPTDLFDDAAEFVFVHSGGRRDVVRLREGTRDTVRGGDRWWVIEAESIEANELSPKAVVRLSTGTFLRMEAHDERPIKVY